MFNESMQNEPPLLNEELGPRLKLRGKKSRTIEKLLPDTRLRVKEPDSYFDDVYYTRDHT